MREPTLAVIVPNYNDSRYIVRCLRSILAQEVMPDELIVVDDCSSDDSVEVIRSLIGGREGIVLIENPVNLGVYGAVDAGLRRSSSEYVLFLSANDFVLPGIFARARTCLAKHPGAGLWSAMGWLVDEADQPIRIHSLAVPSLCDKYFSPEACVELAWRLGSWFTGTTAIYHRATLDAVGRFDPAYKGLSDLITVLMVTGKRGAVFSPIPYAVIRRHSGSYLSNTLNDPHALEQLLNRLRQKGAAIAPELFTSKFLERTARRFRFAAIRASNGDHIGDYAALSSRVARPLLTLVSVLIPRRFGLVRVACAFLILRPFDIVPSLWNRLLGTFAIARRTQYGGS